VDCTVDSCEEATGCLHLPDDAACDDGEFCNGNEICDPLEACQPGPLPCTSKKSCDETADACLEDADQDGEPDVTDNCPSVANSNQLDTDEDGFGDACDNCRKVANADPVPPGRLATGGQTDDDQDGFGNPCDGDFTEADGDRFVNVLDLLLMLEAFGELRGSTNCPDSTGSPTGSCARYDLDVSGEVINVNDLVLMTDDELFGKPMSEQGCSPADDALIHCPLP
jgi:hypothetical protein